VLGEGALHGLAARDRLEDRDVAAVAEEVLGALEDRLDVRAREVGVERLAALPALDDASLAGSSVPRCSA